MHVEDTPSRNDSSCSSISNTCICTTVLVQSSSDLLCTHVTRVWSYNKKKVENVVGALTPFEARYISTTFALALRGAAVPTLQNKNQLASVRRIYKRRSMSSFSKNNRCKKNNLHKKDRAARIHLEAWTIRVNAFCPHASASLEILRLRRFGLKYVQRAIGSTTGVRTTWCWWMCFASRKKEHMLLFAATQKQQV